ncbi:MAG TPA: ammonium transporter [Pyrodictium sp.]|nr:ammonium transporter [Pyrodictium sp.]
MSGFNPGNTAWMLTATFMVVLMSLSLGFFYGGMVWRKNVGISDVTITSIVGADKHPMGSSKLRS